MENIWKIMRSTGKETQSPWKIPEKVPGRYWKSPGKVGGNLWKNIMKVPRKYQ